MKRILIISNRLPIKISKRKGVLSYTSSTGGLATGLGSLTIKGLWVGWPGLVTKVSTERDEIIKKLAAEKMIPVFLSRADVEKYYEGFSNKIIWPLFHYFSQYAVYDNSFWGAYLKVNKHFCDEVLKIAEPDDIIWVHDYHLMLLPQLIREKLPNICIGFFLHIPFPSYEIFRSLPWRTEILEGLLGADLIGFHAYDYVRHFHSAVARIIGLDHMLGKITYHQRIVKVDSFPMGIDFEKYANAPNKREVKKEISKHLQKIGNRRLILSIDRLDYSKGILQRLEAFHLFLHKNPEYREKVILMMVVVPSRSKVESYRRLKHQLDEAVGRINGEHGTIGWMPVWYLYQSFAFNGLCALYTLSDVAMITPYRDGMNLIAKEFVATKIDGKGMLVLSEMAGAANELGEALIVNPNNISQIAEALRTALEMSKEEQIWRNREMQQKIKRYNVDRWAKDFLEGLVHTKELQKGMLTKHLNSKTIEKLLDDYSASSSRLIFLDYDGSLVPFNKDPQQAKPDCELLEILKELSRSDRNKVIIISGRDKFTLEKWFKGFDIGVVAEHGAWLFEKESGWQLIEPLSKEWKNEVRPLLEFYVDRTPGAQIEEKEFSLVWHYRKTDVGLGERRARELAETLIHLTSNLDLQVLEGSKVVEVKNFGVNKGKAASRWLTRKNWNFIMAVGDDWTDEDLFKVLPEDAYSIKVGVISSIAKHSLKSYQEVRSLLSELIRR